MEQCTFGSMFALRMSAIKREDGRAFLSVMASCMINDKGPDPGSHHFVMRRVRETRCLPAKTALVGKRRASSHRHRNKMGHGHVDHHQHRHLMPMCNIRNLFKNPHVMLALIF
jgi:hypothetical protein